MRAALVVRAFRVRAAWTHDERPDGTHHRHHHDERLISLAMTRNEPSNGFANTPCNPRVHHLPRLRRAALILCPLFHRFPWPYEEFFGTFANSLRSERDDRWIFRQHDRSGFLIHLDTIFFFFRPIDNWIFVIVQDFGNIRTKNSGLSDFFERGDCAPSRTFFTKNK